MAGVRVDQLGDRNAGAAEVDALLVLALARMQPQLARAVLVAGDHAPRVLDPLAIPRDLQARLAREESLVAGRPIEDRCRDRSDLGEPDRV